MLTLTGTSAIHVPSCSICLNAAQFASIQQDLSTLYIPKSVPVARLDCHYETNRAPNSDHQQPTVCMSHFDSRSYDKTTEAISNVNILPEAGLHNGAIGTVVEIVYHNRPEGPLDKEHYHLPDYVVVDFPNLKLPPGVPPWDQYHKTVSLKLTLSLA